MSWELFPGAAKDIGTLDRKFAWHIGVGAVSGGFNIWRPNTAGGWNHEPGGAVHMAMSPEGTPWVVNSNGVIFRYNGSGWSALPGWARDIGVGPNGQAWMAGHGKTGPGGGSVFRWDGAAWVWVPGAEANRIAVSPEGTPWIVNTEGKIFRLNGNTWTHMGTGATDIGVGPNGQVWIIGHQAAPGGYKIWRWVNGTWQDAGGAAVRISVGRDGYPWICNSNGAIFRWNGPVGSPTPSTQTTTSTQTAPAPAPTPPAQTASPAETETPETKHPAETASPENAPPQATPTPDVLISTLVFKGEVARTQADEYVVITNRGTGPADLSGWVLRADDAGQDFKFPAGTTLEPGKSIRVYTNEVHAETGGFSFGFGRAIWNDAGDVARLEDAAGKSVAEFAYGDKVTMTPSE